MNKNDTEAIVKEFLELWQKQFAYMSRDGNSATQALDAFQQMQDAYVNAIGAGLGTNNAKSATTSDILRSIGNEFVKLAKSYAQLEERIAKLESGTAGEGSSAPEKAQAKETSRAGKRTTKTNN